MRQRAGMSFVSLKFTFNSTFLLLNTTNLNTRNKLMNWNSRKPVKPEDLLRNVSFIQIIFGSLQERDYNTVITQL